MSSDKALSENVYIDILGKKLARFSSDEGKRISSLFVPRPSDVLVTTHFKCGTTWMQQIVHQLRSGGDMDFDDIGDVVPFIELAYDCEIDLDAEQKYQPRCYKTHLQYHSCPKGGKHIVIYREPCAAMYSGFNFFKGWFFQPGQISLEEYVRSVVLAKKEPHLTEQRTSIFYHLPSWWSHRNDGNVLFLFYEDMKEDLESVVRAVALFMGIEDETRIKKAVEMSSFAFMKANGEKFKEWRIAKYRNKTCGIPLDHIPNRVATGTTTRALDVMSDDLKNAIQKKWEETVGKETGYKDYQELRRCFRKEKPLI